MRLLDKYGRKESGINILILDKVKMECTSHEHCKGCVYSCAIGCFLFTENHYPNSYLTHFPCNWKIQTTHELNYIPGISEIFDALSDMSIQEKLELGIYERIENVTTG